MVAEAAGNFAVFKREVTQCNSTHATTPFLGTCFSL